MSANSSKSVWSELWLKEDYWAIWLGFFLLVVGCILFLSNPPEGMETKIQIANTTMDNEAARAPFKTIAYYKAQDSKAGLMARNLDVGKKIAAFLENHSDTFKEISAFIDKHDVDTGAYTYTDSELTAQAAIGARSTLEHPPVGPK